MPAVIALPRPLSRALTVRRPLRTRLSEKLAEYAEEKRKRKGLFGRG